MNAGEAKAIAKRWVEGNIPSWPGLEGAHLVGGITQMSADEPFPSYKDVDVHLIFAPRSPLLRPASPFQNIIEESYEGVSIEAGIKPIEDYDTPEKILANPEIAHHLTLDSLLFDPGGRLSSVQPTLKREYPRRKWVRARVEFERKAQKEAVDQRAGARETMGGTAAEVGLLTYSFTFIPALFSIVTLRAPTTGSRSTLRVREVVTKYGMPSLYEDLLTMLGVAHLPPQRAEQLLREGSEAFDRAVKARRTPHPFQHKLHEHLRPYFVESCLSLISEGYHREAAVWLTPYYLSATAVIMVDGAGEEKPEYAARLDRFLRDLGVDSEEAIDDRFRRAKQLYDQCFALADEIVSTNPDILE